MSKDKVNIETGANDDNNSNDDKIGDRRPLASRNTGWAHKATALLAKTNIQPNHISMGSMVFAAMAGALYFAGGQWGWAAQAILWALAALACQLRLFSLERIPRSMGRHFYHGRHWLRY